MDEVPAPDVPSAPPLSEARTRALLASIVESSEDAIISKDLNGMVMTWNQAAERLFGYRAEEMIGQPILRLIPPDHPEEESGILARIRRGERVEHYETVRVRKDGRRIDVSLTVSPIRDDAGGIIGASKIARDITERKQAEQALRERTAELEATLRAFPDLFFRVAADGTILNYESQSATHELHVAPEPFVGKRMVDVLPPRVGQQLARALQEAQATRRLVTTEYSLPLPGGERAYEGRLMPVLDNQVVVLVRDITERHRTERTLRESQQRLREQAALLDHTVQARTASLRDTIAELEAFSYSITHDLRAPLRAMQGFAQCLAEDCGEAITPAGKEYIRRIIASANRMDRLIQDVLAYSRVVRTELKLTPVDLDKLVRGIIESYPNFRARGARIEVGGRLPCVHGNEAALTQCISNLLGNAVKFVAPGVTPQVWIRAESHGDTARLWIEDNGIGIEREHWQRIFQMFQRLHKTYEGTGIGLAIVQKAVERMGGTVGLDSVPGQGSRFWIQLRTAE